MQLLPADMEVAVGLQKVKNLPVNFVLGEELDIDDKIPAVVVVVLGGDTGTSCAFIALSHQCRMPCD